MPVRTLLFCVLITFATSLRGERGVASSSEFPFEYREGLLWVQVSIPQRQEPLRFLLDSGAQVSVINLETAKQLGLGLGRKVRVRGVHASMTGYWPQALHASAAGVDLSGRYLALDLSKLSHACEQPVDGLLGADFFRDRIVQIDFAAGRIRLLETLEGIASVSSLPLDCRACGMRVKASVNGGKPEWFRVDTGCATPIQWVTARTRLEGGSPKVAIGLAEVKIPQRRTTLELGGRTFRDVPTGIHRTVIFPGEAGLLGADLFSRFETVTFDTRTQRLALGRLRDSG